MLGEHRVAYLDFHGSGAETIAHLRENGRITIMFCAFQGPPTIVRLHGAGRVVPVTDPEFAPLVRLFPDAPDTHSARSVIDVDVRPGQRLVRLRGAPAGLPRAIVTC